MNAPFVPNCYHFLAHIFVGWISEKALTNKLVCVSDIISNLSTFYYVRMQRGGPWRAFEFKQNSRTRHNPSLYTLTFCYSKPALSHLYGIYYYYYKVMTLYYYLRNFFKVETVLGWEQRRGPWVRTPHLTGLFFSLTIFQLF